MHMVINMVKMDAGCVFHVLIISATCLESKQVALMIADTHSQAGKKILCASCRLELLFMKSPL